MQPAIGIAAIWIGVCLLKAAKVFFVIVRSNRLSEACSLFNSYKNFGKYDHDWALLAAVVTSALLGTNPGKPRALASLAVGLFVLYLHWPYTLKNSFVRMANHWDGQWDIPAGEER